MTLVTRARGTATAAEDVAAPEVVLREVDARLRVRVAGPGRISVPSASLSVLSSPLRRVGSRVSISSPSWLDSPVGIGSASSLRAPRPTLRPASRSCWWSSGPPEIDLSVTVSSPVLSVVPSDELRSRVFLCAGMAAVVDVGASLQCYSGGLGSIRYTHCMRDVNEQRCLEKSECGLPRPWNDKKWKCGGLERRRGREAVKGSRRLSRRTKGKKIA